MVKIVDSAQRRRELADATARVIARHGIEGASLRTVAAEAGWTTGALAHYFRDKHELLEFTLTTSLESRRALRGDRAELTVDESVRAALVNALPVTEEARMHWVVTVAFASVAAHDDRLAAVQRDAYREFRAYLCELVGSRSRSDRDGDRFEAERLIALVDGIALQSLFDPHSWPPERQLAALDAGLALGTPTLVGSR